MTSSHMAREVRDIPVLAARFLSGSADAVSAVADALRALDPPVVATVARGSSDHAAAYLKYAIEIASGVPVASLGPSVVSVYGRPLRLQGAACIGISQSGQSPDIVATMAEARRAGALTLAVTNHPDSPMAVASTHCLPLDAGTEQSVAATKTFVTSVLAGLAVLAEWQRDAALGAAVAALPAAFEQALALDWRPLAERLAGASSVYVLGRGPAYAIACEAALKFKETCGLHAEAFSAAEVLHGPSAIVQAGFPVLALAVADAAGAGVGETAGRLAGQGADVLVTGGQVAGKVGLPAVAPLHPLVDPLVLVVAFYAMVEALSRQRGFDPDRPRHLRKVTETR